MSKNIAQAPIIIYSNTNHIVEESRSQKNKQPIFITLIVIGIIGAGIAGIGFAAFGGHQLWWGIGLLTNISQVSSILIMSISGGSATGLFIVGIIGIVKNRKSSQSQSSVHSIVNDSQPIPKLQSCYSHLDASYDHTDNSGIVDLVYCDSELSYGCVVDGTGHNNPVMQPLLKQHFDSFIETYSKGLKEIQNEEELVQYFEQQIIKLESQFKDKNLEINHKEINPPDKEPGTFLEPSYKPAMSFVQLIQSNGKLMLLTAQAADTMVVVEMPNGELLKTQPSKNDYGVGDTTYNVSIKSFDITGAKRVIGFSDGIGEFVTFNELKEVVNQTQSDELFAKLKEKVLSEREFNPNESAATGAYIKKYNKTKSSNVDDMSLFVLDI